MKHEGREGGKVVECMYVKGLGVASTARMPGSRVERAGRARGGRFMLDAGAGAGLMRVGLATAAKLARERVRP